MFTQLEIEYANPYQLDDTYNLTFNLRQHSVVDRWVNKVLIAQKKFSIDDPGRFYGFNSIEQQRKTALNKINQTIAIINNFKPVIQRTLSDVSDQDTLNYLHHIFEVYHGLLDNQTSDFWLQSPPEVHCALADLNIQVHECEFVSRNVINKPTHAVTWYNLPKIGMLTDAEYSLFEPESKCGTVYLLYTEIGKTLEDLAQDNDRYIHEDAFRPFRHYSADFFVNFYNDDARLIEENRVKIKEYYTQNKEFFEKRGLPIDHPHLTTGRLPVADIVNFTDNTITNLKSRQWVKSIKFN